MENELNFAMGQMTPVPRAAAAEFYPLTPSALAGWSSRRWRRSLSGAVWWSRSWTCPLSRSWRWKRTLRSTWARFAVGRRGRKGRRGRTGSLRSPWYEQNRCLAAYVDIVHATIAKHRMFTSGVTEYRTATDAKSLTFILGAAEHVRVERSLQGFIRGLHASFSGTLP